VGRLQKTTDALGGTKVEVYDLAGQLVQQRNQLGAPTNYTYNSRGWQVEQTDTLGDTTTTSYDDTGNVTEVINARLVATNRKKRTEKSFRNLYGRSLRIADAGAGLSRPQPFGQSAHWPTSPCRLSLPGAAGSPGPSASG
jgi:YD repeat-containing protein